MKRWRLNELSRQQLRGWRVVLVFSSLFRQPLSALSSCMTVTRLGIWPLREMRPTYLKSGTWSLKMLSLSHSLDSRSSVLIGLCAFTYADNFNQEHFQWVFKCFKANNTKSEHDWQLKKPLRSALSTRRSRRQLPCKHCWNFLRESVL